MRLHMEFSAQIQQKSDKCNTYVHACRPCPTILHWLHNEIMSTSHCSNALMFIEGLWISTLRVHVLSLSLSQKRSDPNWLISWNSSHASINTLWRLHSHHYTGTQWLCSNTHTHTQHASIAPVVPVQWNPLFRTPLGQLKTSRLKEVSLFQG